MEQRSKHPSYNSQRIPTMQLMGQVASFTGLRKDVAAAKAREFVESNGNYGQEKAARTVQNSAIYGQPPLRQSATVTSGPTILDPTYNAQSANTSAVPLNTSNYKANPKNHQNESDVGKLFKPADPTAVPPIPLPSKRMLGSNHSNQNNNVIGGYTDVADPWQTTTQSAQEGEKIEFKSRHSMKKRLSELEPEDMISPITGNRVADYGHWAEDLKAKRAAAQANAEADESDEEETEQDPLLKRLKTQLASRGAKGIAGLARLFRIMDDDASGALCFAEFKKAMRDCQMVLTEMELLVLFKRFDRENTGAITYNNFLTAVTGSLNKRRRKLVNMAFDVLDKDGSGVIELNDIAAAYDVSLHPDFISGKRSKDDILREFMDGFDVGGVKDGKVTREEFANYYSTISCSIARDDYFELMIRNAWHISGGEGAAANSANRRVLVTRADGSQFVQEITNDLGLSGKDKAGMTARLKAQGVEAANIDLYGAAGDDSKSLGKVGPRPVTKKSNKKFAAPETKVKTPVEPTPGLKLIIAKIKSEMKARGSGGFVGLQRRFRIMDDDGSKSLCLNEFKKALKEFKMDLTEADLRALFSFFDADNSGSIDFEEFVQAVRDPLSARRLKLVHMAFAVIDKDGSGIVDAQEVASMYDASKHPEVIARRKTPTQVLTEFLDTFDVGGVKDGMVTKQEFENYYANLGASIDNEDYFELMIRNAWHLSSGEGNCANSTNMRVLVTDTSGREITVQIENDLGLKKDDLAGIYARLKAQGVKDIKSINGRAVTVAMQNGKETVTAGTNTSQLNTNEFKIPQVQRAPPVANRVSAPGPPSLATLNLSASQPVAMRSGLAAKVMTSLQQKQAEQDRKEQEIIVGNTLLDVLRVQLLSRGPAGIIELQRKFVDMDKDGSKSLDYNEFKQAVLSNKLTYSEDQLKALFNFFDADGSGAIDYDELLYGLRGQLPPNLLVLVHQVFDLLDKPGVDSIDPQTLIAHFDASRHPEVLSRAKSAQDVQKEFLDTFDVGGELPGRITRAEFVRYYTNIRASYNDDDYFEVVLRKVWHMGEEVSASSAQMNAFRDHLNGRTKEVSTLAGKLRQAQSMDAATSRRPSSASATRRPSANQSPFATMGASAAFNQNFAAPAPAFARTTNNNNAPQSYTAPSAPAFPARPQSARPLGRGRLNPQYTRANNSATSAPAPPPAYEQIEVVDATGNVDEDAVWKAAKKIQSEAVQSYNNQQYAEAEEKFRDVFEVMKMLFHPTHPEYIKAEKSCLMVQRKRAQMSEYARPGSARGYGY